MDDNENELCPLCCEELDISDRQFFPCKCGYQVCMWCWHRIRESESGLCPACRTPYGDDPHEFSAVDMEEVVKANKEKAAAEKREKEKHRQQQLQQAQAAAAGSQSVASYGNAPSIGQGSVLGSVMPATGETVTSVHAVGENAQPQLYAGTVIGSLGGTDASQTTPNRITHRSRTVSGSEGLKDRSLLANMRVIRRNLVYTVGLPPSVATEDILKKSDYFGQYGKITKIVINRNYSGSGDPRRASASAYITFVHKEDALACILAVDGFTLEGRNIRASFGTSKYCSAFIKNVRCNNPECTYLHHMGESDDNFTKQEIQAGYVTSGRDVAARQQLRASVSNAVVSSIANPASLVGDSRRKGGGSGPSGTGKAAGQPIFPPPSFDDPRSANQIPPLPGPRSLNQHQHLRSSSVGTPSHLGDSGNTSSVGAAVALSPSCPVNLPSGGSVGSARKGKIVSPMANVGSTKEGSSTNNSRSTSPSIGSLASFDRPAATAASVLVASECFQHLRSNASKSNIVSALTPLEPLKRTASVPGSSMTKTAPSGASIASRPLKNSITGGEHAVVQQTTSIPCNLENKVVKCKNPIWKRLGGAIVSDDDSSTSAYAIGGATILEGDRGVINSAPSGVLGISSTAVGPTPIGRCRARGVELGAIGKPSVADHHEGALTTVRGYGPIGGKLTGLTSSGTKISSSTTSAEVSALATGQQSECQNSEGKTKSASLGDSPGMNWGGASSGSDIIFASTSSNSPFSAIGGVFQSEGLNGDSNANSSSIWSSSNGVGAVGSPLSLARRGLFEGTCRDNHIFGENDGAFLIQTENSGCNMASASTSALASILGINLPTGSGSLRETSFNVEHTRSPSTVRVPQSSSRPIGFGAVGSLGQRQKSSDDAHLMEWGDSSSSYSGNTVPLAVATKKTSTQQGGTFWGSDSGLLHMSQGQALDHRRGFDDSSEARSAYFDEAPIGGITIGGGAGSGGSLSHDVALLQSFLPGVHISTTGGVSKSIPISNHSDAAVNVATGHHADTNRSVGNIGWGVIGGGGFAGSENGKWGTPSGLYEASARSPGSGNEKLQHTDGNSIW